MLNSNRAAGNFEKIKKIELAYTFNVKNFSKQKFDRCQ